MHNLKLIKQIKRTNILLVSSYFLFAVTLSFFYFSLGINAAIAAGIVALALELTLIYELNQYKKELNLYIKRG